MNKMRLMSPLVAATGGFLVTLPAMADSGGDGYWGHHGMMSGGGFGWFMAPVMMLLFLVAVVIVVMLVIRWLGGPDGGMASSSGQAGPSARQILEERFARGEIDEEEFRKRKKALEE